MVPPSLLFFSGHSWVRAEGGTAGSLALARRGVGEERQLYPLYPPQPPPLRWGSLGWSTLALQSASSTSFLTGLFRSWLPSLALIMLLSARPTPHTPLWAPSLSQEPHPPPRSRACHSGTMVPSCLPIPSHRPASVGFCAFAHSCSPLSPSLSLPPPPLLISTLPSVGLCLPSHLCPAWSPPFCLLCPHGLSYRGASTSPTSACHLHSE